MSELGKITRLSEYLLSRGASFGNVDIRASLDGYGIFSTDAIPAQSPLLVIPVSQCLSAERVSEHHLLQKIFTDNPGLLDYPDEVLAIGVMFAELHPDLCDWSLHVATFPRSINSTLYWSESEMLELKDNAIFHITGMLKRQIEHDFNSIHRPFGEAYSDLLGGVTLDLYTWALSMVYSRAIEFMRSGKCMRCIVPVLDMANHDPEIATDPTDTFCFDEEQDSVSLKSCVALSPNKECFAVYGVYPNSKLLLTYGFVVQNNPVRAIDLWTKPHQTIFSFDMKMKLLQAHPLTRNQTYDFKGTIRPGFVSPALLATIRVVQADEGDLPHLQNAFCGRIVSLRNEAASYVSLRNLILARMKLENAEVGSFFSIFLVCVMPLCWHFCLVGDKL
jgi:hypothetical protein